jgi:hypothetical protein
MARWLVRNAPVAVPVVLSAIGIAVSARYNDSDHQWMAAFAGWVTGWFCCLAAIAASEVGSGRPLLGQPCREQPTWSRAELSAMLIVLSAAAVLRVVVIESYPIALHNDEMSCLLEARNFIDSDRALFTVGWLSCPRLGFFLSSLPMRVAGPTLLTLRLSTAALGLLSLAATYLLVRRLFGARPAVLLLILTTPYHWHLHFSRAGFHNMQAVSCTTIGLLLFAVAADRRSPVLFGCAGVVTGIGWQTYWGAWLTPLILAAWALTRFAVDRVDGRVVLKGLGVTMALFLVTLAPLVAFYAGSPIALTNRPDAVSILSERSRPHMEAVYRTTDLRIVMGMNAHRVVKLFVGGAGDTSVQYGLQDRFIDPFVLPLFLVGLAYAATLLRAPGGQLLWIWFLGTLIAGGVLTSDAPFSPRLTGVTPIVLLFPALAVDRLLRARWIAANRWLMSAVGAAVAALVVLSTWWNLHTTFVRYPSTSRFGNRDLIVRLAAKLGNVRTIVNFAEPEDFDHQAFRALAPDARGRNLEARSRRAREVATVVKSYGPGTLVILPFGDNRFYGLCDRIGSSAAGISSTRHGLVGFEWCYIE